MKLRSIKEGKTKAKQGNKRVDLEVKGCFASLLRLIVDLLPQTTQELAMAMDATSAVAITTAYLLI